VTIVKGVREAISNSQYGDMVYNGGDSRGWA
jgi:hypothetical protein